MFPEPRLFFCLPNEDFIKKESLYFYTLIVKTNCVCTMPIGVLGIILTLFKVGINM